MSTTTAQLTEAMTKGPPIEQVAADAAMRSLGAVPPADYMAFMIKANGAEGPVGNGYLVLWPMDQLAELNDAYHVAEFAPSLVVFGSDGGDTAYAFDKRSPGTIVSVPFVGMDDEAPRRLAGSFVEFIQGLVAS